MNDARNNKPNFYCLVVLAVLVFFTPFKTSASILEKSATIRGLSLGFKQDFTAVHTSLSQKKNLINQRVSQVSLLSDNFSPSLDLNLSSRISKNQKALSFIKEETVSGINTLSSQINLVKVEKNDLKPKPYLESFSSKVKETGSNLLTSLKAPLLSLRQSNLKNQETAFIHESILKNVKETVRESLPSIPSLFSDKKENNNKETENSKKPAVNNQPATNDNQPIAQQKSLKPKTTNEPKEEDPKISTEPKSISLPLSLSLSLSISTSIFLPFLSS